MGITVIPALANSTLPASAAATAGTATGTAGGFAALLNGELLSLMGAAAEPDEMPLSDSKDTQRSDAGEDQSDIADAALLASLFGQPAGSEVQTRSVRTSATGASDGGHVAANAATARAMPEGPADPADIAARTKPQEAGGSFEKLMQGATAATAGTSSTPAALRPAAANIAGESAVSEGPPPVAGQLAAPTTTASGDASAMHSQRSSINAHVHSAAWPQQLGDKIVWLARTEQQTAQLNINPPQLGPLQITLNLSGDQASIAFASPHAEVRQAIESAMPQLKEMLSSAGINLGQSNVGANLSQQRADNPFSDANGTRSGDENAILPANDKAASTAGTAVLHRGRGLVDLFA